MINKMPHGFKYLKSCNSEAGDLLAEHFIYFDIFASQSNENGTFFPISDYQDHFNETSLDYDPLQGCVRPITLVIGRIINLLVESSSLNSIYNDQSVIDRDIFDCDKYEILTDILQRANELEREIEFAKPDMHALKVLKTSSDLEVHLTHFEAFQLSSQIYLKQVIKKLPPITLEIQMLFLNLKTIIPLLINSSLKKNLAFPLMILGISAVSKEDKEVTRSHLEHLIQNYGYSSSYQKILTVVEKVWSTNDNGTINVEWFQITRDLGWRLNLGR